MRIQHDPTRPPSETSAARWLAEHGDALYAFAVARVRDPHAAEDLVQETLLAALAAGGFEGRSAERTWLIGILRHKVLDALRRTWSQRPAGSPAGPDALDDLFDRRGHWKVSPSRWGGDPSELAQRAEFRDVLSRCLARLPARMAQLFWLREAEEMGTPELCDRLNVTAANAWALLHRARVGLRRCLSIHWFDGERRP